MTLHITDLNKLKADWAQVVKEIWRWICCKTTQTWHVDTLTLHSSWAENQKQCWTSASSSFNPSQSEDKYIGNKKLESWVCHQYCHTNLKLSSYTTLVCARAQNWLDSTFQCKQNQWRVLGQRTHQKRIKKSQGFLFFCPRDDPPTSTQTISPSSSLMLPCSWKNC